MNEVVLIFGILFFIAGIVLQYKNRRVAKALEYIAQVKFVEKARELNEIALYLDDQMKRIVQRNKDVEFMFCDVVNKRAQVNQIHRENKQLIKDANQAIKENKVEQFYVKEASLLVYDHYKKLTGLINKFVNSGELDYEECFRLSYTADNNMLFMNNYFRRNFRMSPEDYTQQKTQLIGKTQSGEDYISNFSKN